MLSWFTENSLPPLIGGSLMAIAFLGLAFYFYSRAMLYLALGVIAITALIVTIETLIVTEREKITRMVYDLAKAVEQNRMEDVLAVVAPSRTDAQQQIKAEMPQYQFTSCRVLGIKSFKLNPDGRQAEIVFVVFASGSNYQMGKGNVHRRVTLYFEKQSDDNWKLIDYHHEAPTAGYRL
jgi:ketosteroid isomerase-like protein